MEKYLTVNENTVVLGDSQTQWLWIPNKENSVWGYIYEPESGKYLTIKDKVIYKRLHKEY